MSDLFPPMEAQGTKVRVLASKIENATFTQDGLDVTVTLAGHGQVVGDRFEVLTAVGSDSAIGRFTVTGTTTNTFTFTTEDEDDVAAGAAMTLRKFLDVEAKSITGPGGSAAVIDATTLSSAAKDKMLGLKDNGQLGFTIYYNPSHPAHMTLDAARSSRKRLPVELSFTDAARTFWGMNVLVLTVPISAAGDALVDSAVNTEVTGEIERYN